jgi:hypothetical protein
VRPSRPLRQLLRHPATRWGGALLAAILAVGQVLLLQHRVEQIGGGDHHCAVCIAGKALDHAAIPTGVPLPEGSWTDVDPSFEPGRATCAEAPSPRARGPPTAATA